MALVDVKGPLYSLDTCSGGNAPTSATEKYTVLYDGLGSETSADALNETGIPVGGDAHPSNANLKVNQKQASRRGKSNLFDVIINYNTIDVTIGGSSAVAPLDRDTIWNERGRPSQVEIDTQATGTSIQNKAGDVIRVTIPYSDLTLEAIKNYASRTDFTSYFNKVNSAVFQGFAAKRLFLPHVDQVYTEELFDGEIETYWQARFLFQVRLPRTATDLDTWEYRIVHEGTVELDGSDRKNVVDPKTFQKMSVPVPLDATGAALAAGGTILYIDTSGTPSASGKIDVYQTANFTLIGL
jgi:hypothetical protein